MRLASGAFLLSGAALALACSKGPRLPRELTFEGVKLEKATDWSRGSVSGIIFVPRAEKLETASLQVGILASSGHASGAALHTWLMDQYHRSPTTQWHESETSDEACKVGIPAAPEGGPLRPFLALHVCRSGSGGSACAEADERLSEEIMARCLNRGWGCWDELCTQKWAARRAALEAILSDVGAR